jgi:hypothetical protein
VVRLLSSGSDVDQFLEMFRESSLVHMESSGFSVPRLGQALRFVLPFASLFRSRGAILVTTRDGHLETALGVRRLRWNDRSEWILGPVCARRKGGVTTMRDMTLLYFLALAYCEERGGSVIWANVGPELQAMRTGLPTHGFASRRRRTCYVRAALDQPSGPTNDAGGQFWLRLRSRILGSRYRSWKVTGLENRTLTEIAPALEGPAALWFAPRRFRAAADLHLGLEFLESIVMRGREIRLHLGRLPEGGEEVLSEFGFRSLYIMDLFRRDGSTTGPIRAGEHARLFAKVEISPVLAPELKRLLS